jgi:hypothetical protein
VTCCNDHHDEVDVLDLTGGEQAETETFHMCGDDCTCGHGLAIEDGHVL